MTMNDIKAMETDWLTPATVASVLHMDPGRLIWYAKNGQLPFACRVSGNRVLVSRKSLLDTYGHGEAEMPTERLMMNQILEELTAIREELKAFREVLKGRSAS